tara:strand:- start:4119 stop:6182 length:2064 start_codon:yes stop_codon:yes gene_type:complete
MAGTVAEGTQYTADNLLRAEKSRRMSAAGRDIGDIPDVVNKDRREKCQKNLRLFFEQYHPDLFHRKWSEDHLKAIAKLEAAILEGGQFALAMPRGSGKTTMCYIACEWALLYAHRSFVVLVGAEATAALELLDAVRTDMENNESLLEDFPEVIFPIRQLEGIAHRCNGQTCNGERTQMSWTSDRVVLPTVNGSKASGATLRVVGLTGRLRGMQSKTPDGHSIRPDLVVVDDPQTDDSARSVSQNDYRERLLSGAVLGLAGPGEPIAAVMPCTVIRHGDMADRILDRQRHPEWRGERTQLVYEWPKCTKLWDEYADIWSAELRNDGDGSAANEFYRNNQTQMDEGAKVGWPERFQDNEISAIQHAFNLKLKIGEEAFNSEYQNQPADIESLTNPISITADDLSAKVSKVKRGIVPIEFDRLVGFIDISQKCLWWTVMAFGKGFAGTVIDYGIWPDQGTRYSRLSSIKRTLQRRYPGNGLEAAILRGMEECTGHMMQNWKGETGGEFQVERLLVDEGDGEHTQIVRSFCRRSDFSAVLIPSKGRGIRASNSPLCSGKQRQNERFGTYWKIVRNRDNTRSVHVDVNYWKTFAMRRLEAPSDDSGSVDLYKATPRHHQMFADQVTAEKPTEVEDVASGNRVIEWANSRQLDNHYFDCLVGCHAAASMLGCTLTAQQPIEPARPKRKKVEYL